MRPVPLYLALVALGCSAIWAGGAFVPQDAPAHVYTASRMLGLLNHDAAIGALFTFNSFLLPNSTGHWLLALLLGAVSPLTAIRILATVTYAGLVAGVGFLRFSTAGRDGLATSLLIGAAIGFNWLWLCGLNNFLLGTIGFAFGLGLFHLWRDSLTAPRVLWLSLVLLFVYFSHVVAFAALAAALVVSAAEAAPENRGRAAVGAFAALAPAALLALLFAASSAPGALAPAWRRLADPLSIASWLQQIRAADPFVLISRRAFPFATGTSDAFAVFTPLAWLLAAFAGLAAGTLARGAGAGAGALRGKLAFLAALAGCALAAALGPDDFGTSHGTLLRERLALLGALCFVPLFRTSASARTTRLAQACLAFVFLFQTAALWEYTRRSDRDAREYLALGDAAGSPASLASVVVLEDGRRFHSNPAAQLGNLLGVGRPTVVWDNYEAGYDIFPVVARSPDDRRFALDFTSSNVFDPQDPPERFEAALARLDACLAAGHGRIDTLLSWSRDPRVDAVVGKWFETEPFFERGRGRLFRRRAERSAP